MNASFSGIKANERTDSEFLFETHVNWTFGKVFNHYIRLINMSFKEIWVNLVCRETTDVTIHLAPSMFVQIAIIPLITLNI